MVACFFTSMRGWGSNSGLVRPTTLTLLFAVSLLSTRHQGVITLTGELFRLMCLGRVIFLFVNFHLFNLHVKSPTQCLGLEQSSVNIRLK